MASGTSQFCPWCFDCPSSVTLVLDRPSEIRNRYPLLRQHFVDLFSESIVTNTVPLAELSGRLCEPSRPGLTQAGPSPFVAASPFRVSGHGLPSSGFSKNWLEEPESTTNREAVPARDARARAAPAECPVTVSSTNCDGPATCVASAMNGRSCRPLRRTS